MRTFARRNRENLGGARSLSTARKNARPVKLDSTERTLISIHRDFESRRKYSKDRMTRRILALFGLANALENMTDYDNYDEERASNRYLMDSPICQSVEDCANLEGKKEGFGLFDFYVGCDGALFTNSQGTIQISDYKSRFNCRWEIKASPGQHISVKIIIEITKNLYLCAL